MKWEWLHNMKISENVRVRSFRKSETSEFRSFPEMENIGNSGVSRNWITNKYTYLGNSPEFRVVLKPCERILTIDRGGVWYPSRSRRQRCWRCDSMSYDFVLCDIIILFDISMILEGHMTCLYKHQNFLIWLLTSIMSSSIFSSSCDLRSCDSSCVFFPHLLQWF